MAKKNSKDYEQEDRSKRSVKQAARKVISTSTTKAENKKSSTTNAKSDQKSGTQATRNTKTGNSILKSASSLAPAIDRGTQLTHTAAQDSVVSKSKTNKSKISDPFVQAKRSDQDKGSTTQETKVQAVSQGAIISRGLAFPSNHFQNTKTTRNTDKTKTFISGESLLKPIVTFPSSASNRGMVLTRTSAQDSFVANPNQAQRKADIGTLFKTQTVQSNKITGAGRKKSPKVLTQEIWAAVEAGDKQLGYASKLEGELEKKYGNIDYAQYIPEYKNLVKAIQDAQAAYQTQREFIENNYSKLPLPSGRTTNHTNADRWYYEDQLNEVREEMEHYDELCGGRMDLASLRSYYEKIHLYESILAAEPNTKGEQYMDDSLEQVLKGNYTDKVTGLGSVYQVGLALAGLDLPMDIRDASYDWTHLKTTPWWQTTIDTLSILPVAGIIKLLEDVANVKRVGTTIDTVSTAAKRVEEITSLDKVVDDAAEAVKRSGHAAEAGTKASKSAEIQDLDLSLEKKYNEAKEAHAAAANANEAVTYFRVQGGSSKRSKYLILANADGTIRINTSGNLNVSAYNAEHARYFSQVRAENIEVVSFEVPRWFDDFVRETAVLQEKYTLNPLNQGHSAPKMTDLTRPGFTYEFPPIWNDWLAEYAFNAKVVKGGLP